jgi:hypothetical protein
VKSKDDLELLVKWLGYQPKFRLLMRGSKNGFKASKFHFICDKKGPTLTIIKSEHGKIFGAYTSKGHKNSVNVDLESDPEAFIFSVTHKTKHEPVKNIEKIIGHHPMRLIVFGRSEEKKENSDIEIVDECNTHKLSFTNFGNSFSVPQHMTFGSKDCKGYLAGS